MTQSELHTVYVELLNEGTFVLRPTQASRVSDWSFTLRATPNYDSELEEWKFLPGAVVECEWETNDGDHILVAKRQIS